MVLATTSVGRLAMWKTVLKIAVIVIAAAIEVITVVEKGRRAAQTALGPFVSAGRGTEDRRRFRLGIRTSRGHTCAI